MSAVNSQFAVGVHIMAGLGHYDGSEVVSATLTESVNADPSVVRKVLAKLAKAGLVNTSRGRNGFCEIAKPANKISLLDVYRATEAPEVFAVHSYPTRKDCVISSNIKASLGGILEESQSAFEKSLAGKTVADVVGDIRRRMK